MNVLYLHALGPEVSRRESVVEFESMVVRYVPNASVHMVNVLQPCQWPLRQMSWDAVFLGVTMLSLRNNDLLFEYVLETFDWVAEHPAIKVARPQDEYNYSARLDCWLRDWNVGLAYTVCPEHWDVLFPTFRRVGKLKLGFTGYITPEFSTKAERLHPHSTRRTDVLYRASKLPPHFGEFGRLKAGVVDGFLRALDEQGIQLRHDLSTKASETLTGTKWRERLADSRSCLVTPSGSDVIDLSGIYAQRSTKRLMTRADEGSEASVHRYDRPAGWNGLTVIAPRNLEAAMLRTVQIAYPFLPSDVLISGEDYLVLAQDFSNLAEICEKVLDPSFSESIAESCVGRLINHRPIQALHWAEDLTAELDALGCGTQWQKSDQESLSHLIAENDLSLIQPVSRTGTFRRQVLESLHHRTRNWLTTGPPPWS